MSTPRIRQVLAVVAAFVGLSTVVFLPPVEAQTSEIEEAQERANEAARAVIEARDALADTDEDIAALEARAGAAERELAALGDSVEELVISQYMSSGDIPLITDEDLNEGVKAAAYSRYIGQDRLDRIDQYLQIKGELNDAQAELTAARAEQEKRVGDMEQAVEDVQAELEHLQELERQRQAELERQRQEEAERKAAEEAAAAKAAAEQREVQAQAATSTTTTAQESAAAPAPEPDAPVIKTGGGMVCPVAGAVAFIDSWGYSRGGGSRRHKGVDMMAANGTPVVAPVSGTVTHRGNYVGGMSFHLDGDDGNYYYGTHLSGYANQGIGHVEAGTLVGYVGSSGNASASAPHLHFEIHPNASGYSTAVNPYPATKAACG